MSSVLYGAGTENMVPLDPGFIRNNNIPMNYLKKSSLIGSSAALAVVLASTSYANAQVYGADTSLMAVGSAGSQAYYVPMSSLNASQFAVASSNPIPANYQAGYYNYPMSPNTSYPGVPNTGGIIPTSTTANPATATYIAPMTTWSSTSGITGGVSIPVGYTAAIGPNGSTLTTSNWTTTNTLGIPNTGSTLVPNGGTVRVNGIVTIVTPTALGINNGGQTWTVAWNNSTVVVTANSTADIAGGQISVGDSIEVDGVIDSTFSSKINATTIHNLSFH